MAGSIIASVISATNTDEIKAKGRGSFTITTTEGEQFTFALVRTQSGPWKAMYWQRVANADGFFGEPTAVDCMPPTPILRDSEFIARVMAAANAANATAKAPVITEGQGG